MSPAWGQRTYKAHGIPFPGPEEEQVSPALVKLFLLAFTWCQQRGQRCWSVRVGVGHLLNWNCADQGPRAHLDSYLVSITLNIGLIIMGDHIMGALDYCLTLPAETPSCSFCIQMGAMFTVMITSKVGIPVSMTHCISCATVAVGLCNGSANAVN